MPEPTYSTNLTETEVQIILNALDAHINLLDKQRDNQTTTSGWESMSDKVLAAEDIYYKIDDLTPTTRKATW